MTQPSSLMEVEAAEAPASLRRQLDQLAGPLADLGARLRQIEPRLLLTCARGSSDHAATYAKHLVETRLGVPTVSIAPSVSSLYATPWRPLAPAACLALSQSGRSPDLVAAAKAAKAAGAFTIALVNAEGAPLSAAADAALPLLAGPERSVAATKSYLASLAAVIGLVAAWAEDESLQAALAAAPERLEAAWAQDWSAALAALRGARSLYVIGRGATLGAAQEVALKLKEVCGLHAEPFSAAEVRHGPMALVKDGFPVLMLPPDDVGAEGFSDLAEAFAQRGAQVLLAGGKAPGAVPLPVARSPHPALTPLLQVQSFYRLAAELSRARGLDPDRPPHLSKVTETR